MRTFLKNALSVAVMLTAAAAPASSQDEDMATFRTWALTPPMGWNSWDCYGAAVTEDIVRANADFMANNLKKYGWEYIVVDIQ